MAPRGPGWPLVAAAGGYRAPFDLNVFGAMAYRGVIGGGQALMLLLLVYAAVFWLYAGVRPRQ